jgi:hypothetical protein
MIHHMAEVIEFGTARASRLERAALAAPNHPALRWAAGTDYSTGHRRRTGQPMTWCGMPGQITIARPGASLCPACYPNPRAR